MTATMGTTTGAIALALALAGAASAQQPTPAQQSAIKSACRSDYMQVCSSVQPGGPAAVHCLQQNAGRVSPACQQALAALGTATPMAPAAAAPAMAPSGGPMRMSLRDELRLTREDCGSDYRTFCQGVRPGGGHAITCLETNAASLSPGCQRALLELKGRTSK